MATIEEVTPITAETVEEAAAQAVDETTEAKPEAIEVTTDAEVTVTIGEEKPEEEQQAAPEWVKELRKNYREAQKRIRELEQKNAPHVQALGEKPTLASFDYDEDKFTAALEEWHRKKRTADAEQERIERQTQTEQQQWQGKLSAYGESKAALKAPDYEDTEAVVQEALSDRQQAIIIKGAKNPALVVLALGKNPGKLKELAGIHDLVEFAFAVANVENQLKVTKRASPPAPERRVQGDASLSGTNENALERARELAAKTGDYTEVTRIKRERASKAA